MVHAEGKFDQCDITDFVEMFACCDALGAGDKSLAFDCKSGLSGGGYCPPNDEKECNKNYLKGIEIVDAYY